SCPKSSSLLPCHNDNFHTDLLNCSVVARIFVVRKAIDNHAIAIETLKTPEYDVQLVSQTINLVVLYQL
ncbi:hypothetical protein, partial [Fischerella thermalis]|uniref:hypothetical protein n=1 Tax=Fischerella thermalis TaxID=372787 RepID=UPI001CA50E58